MKKIKLIYIVGTEHSGSTLLDLIIATSKEVFSVGELQFYTVYKNKEQISNANLAFICTCKKPFEKCSFWSGINQKGDYVIRLKKSKRESFKVMLYALFPFRMFSGNDRFDDSLSLLKEIYAQALKIKPELTYLLDSSKSFIRLFYYLRSPEIEVYPILLIRDGRGVINSRLRIGQKIGFFAAMLQWIINCFISKRLIKDNPRAMHISYNLFCQDPTRYIRVLNKKLNINIPEESFLEQIAHTEYHNIDGNIIKFKKITEIHCDEKWKKEMSTIKKIVSTVLLYPFNRVWVQRDSLNSRG